MSRRVLVLAGVGVVLYAALGLLTDPDVQLVGVLVFLAAVLVIHDGLWMPLVLAALAAAGRIRKNSALAAGGRIRKNSESTRTEDDGAPGE